MVLRACVYNVSNTKIPPQNCSTTNRRKCLDLGNLSFFEWPKQRWRGFGGDTVLFLREMDLEKLDIDLFADRS